MNSLCYLLIGLNLICAGIVFFLLLSDLNTRSRLNLYKQHSETLNNRLSGNLKNLKEVRAERDKLISENKELLEKIRVISEIIVTPKKEEPLPEQGRFVGIIPNEMWATDDEGGYEQ